MITLSAFRNTHSKPLHTVANWLAAAVLCLAGTANAAPGAEAAPPAVQAPQAAGKLSNAGCQTCHDGKKGKLEGKNADGESRELRIIENEKYGKGVHAKMQCVACHTEITDSKAQHRIDPKAKKPDCASCHEQLWDKVKKGGKAKSNERLGKVVDNIGHYKKSFHARPSTDDEKVPNATCNQCHDVHSFDIPPKGTEEHAQWRLGAPKMCGTSCHEDQLEEFGDSVHGDKLSNDENPKSAICSDCHTSHSVRNTSAQPVKQAILESCGDCHEDQFKSYEATRHGKLAAVDGGNPIRCTDCHGSHGVTEISGMKDTRKRVSHDNKMCISCHNSDKKFEKFAPVKTGGKGLEKEARPDLDEQHKWLPNTKLHWQAVRCVDCHTGAETTKSHEILGQKKAERNCVSCHSKDSSLATRLYRHQAKEEKQKYGFANSVILANSYVIGATRHALLDTAIIIIAALTLLGVLGHGAVRYLSAKSRRKNGK